MTPIKKLAVAAIIAIGAMAAAAPANAMGVGGMTAPTQAATELASQDTTVEKAGFRRRVGFRRHRFHRRFHFGGRFRRNFRRGCWRIVKRFNGRRWVYIRRNHCRYYR